jgi:hypothetical protein
VNVERHQSLGVDTALGERDDVADVEIVDRDIQIRAPLFRHEAVDIDPAGRSVSQLETVDIHARLPPVKRRGMRASPHAGVELQPHVIETELVSDLVQRELGVGAVLL